MSEKVLIIIPAYNEEKNIGSVVETLRRTLNHDILVINDGSIDNTELLLTELGVQFVSHPINLNYGGALQTGFKYAVAKGYDYVVSFDGDGQHPAEAVQDLLNICMKTNSDIVIGSRYLNDTNYKQSFARMMGTKFFTLMVKALTGKKITDPTSGFQVLSKRTFSFYSRKSNYPQEFPDANVIIMMILAGYRVLEVPVKMNQRIHGESMHKGLKTIKYMIKMFFSISISVLKGKDQRVRERI